MTNDTRQRAAEGLRLVKAFEAINDQAARRAIVQLAESLAAISHPITPGPANRKKLSSVDRATTSRRRARKSLAPNPKIGKSLNNVKARAGRRE